MAESVSTTVTELPESRVRVQAEVPAAIVIRRVGREAVLDEAVRESLARWYTAAIDAAGVVPVGEPELDLAELPREGEPLRFSIEIGVRPRATLGEYKGLEVGKRDPEVSDEEIQGEL